MKLSSHPLGENPQVAATSRVRILQPRPPEASPAPPPLPFTSTNTLPLPLNEFAALSPLPALPHPLGENFHVAPTSRVRILHARPPAQASCPFSTSQITPKASIRSRATLQPSHGSTFPSGLPPHRPCRRLSLPLSFPSSIDLDQLRDRFTPFI